MVAQNGCAGIGVKGGGKVLEHNRGVKLEMSHVAGGLPFKTQVGYVRLVVRCVPCNQFNFFKIRPR
jgi:hypothetical protein